jgi:hypothetical protein
MNRHSTRKKPPLPAACDDKAEAEAEVAVAYRIYPRISKKPALFENDKRKLAELCLKSFKRSLGPLRIKLWAILDDCPPFYYDLFRTHFGEAVEYITLHGAGNAKSFRAQIDLLLNQNASDVVYFAEDDYFYLPGRFQAMTRFLADHPGDFVSPYDHPDYYTLPFHQHPNRIAVSADGHWRTANSTCLTFMTPKRVLQQTQKTFLTYLKGNSDAGLWLGLTKNGLFNPFFTARNLINGRGYDRIWLKAWYFGWRRILFGKKRNIWVPVPSIATHMEKQYLSPAVDWQAAFREIASEPSGPSFKSSPGN